MSTPSVTIAFCPRERFSLAAKALESIVRSTRMPYTLVIVDCAIPARYLREMEAAVEGRDNVRWIRTGEFAMPARCANLAAAATDDEYVCFIENDCIVTEGWLERMVETALSCAAGVVIPLLMERDDANGFVHHDGAFADIRMERDAQGPLIVVRSDREMIEGWERLTAPLRVTTIESHCCLFSRATLSLIGPLDENLVINAHADTSMRLLAHGVTVLLEPRAHVNHYPPEFDVRDDELAYFRWRWDFARCVRFERALRLKWRTVGLPDSRWFAHGKPYTTSPARWFAYRLIRFPVHRAWRLAQRLTADERTMARG